MSALATQYARKPNAPPPKKPAWGTKPPMNVVTTDDPRLVGTGLMANAATEELELLVKKLSNEVSNLKTELLTVKQLSMNASTAVTEAKTATKRIGSDLEVEKSQGIKSDAVLGKRIDGFSKELVTAEEN